MPADGSGAVQVADGDLAAATGYSPRSLRLVWKELAEMGVVEVDRPGADGVRIVRPLPHPVWAAAAALAEVQA